REDDCDDPARVLAENVVADVDDLLVLDPDYALHSEDFDDQALRDQEAGERDDERGDADESDDRALDSAVTGPDSNSDRNCHQARVVVVRAGELELSDRDAAEAAQVPDRE